MTNADNNKHNEEPKTCQWDIYKRPMLIVDLNSGSYLNTKKGHEELNLDRNPVDGRFYGYCPPNDRINITNLGAKPSDESISGVTVIYTTKVKGTTAREIIAFCTNATIHRNGIHNKALKRTIVDNKKKVYCSYSIESDTLINLTTLDSKFRINVADYNAWMFRKQRVFKGKYKKLDDRILRYIQNYIYSLDSNDDYSYQEDINNQDHNIDNFTNTATNEPQYLVGVNGTSVKKVPAIAKQVLILSAYKCAMDANHKTFNTSKGVPYMEGHHLIPCNYSNTLFFWERYKRNIDCINNIVCLCPTCHRKIHYASNEEKKDMIEQLYKKQRNMLYDIGIDISLNDLLQLYDIK